MQMTLANPRILSVATAVPKHRVAQRTAKNFAHAMFSGVYKDVERLLPVFDNVEIDGRSFCVPPEWFYEDHTFPEKNTLYVEHALGLSEKAARRALDKAGADPAEVGAVFFVSTTGLSTPSIDSQLLPRLGLSEHTRRVPIWGLRCRGGGTRPGPGLRPGLSGREGTPCRGRAVWPDVPVGGPLQGRSCLDGPLRGRRRRGGLGGRSGGPSGAGVAREPQHHLAGHGGHYGLGDS